MSAQNIIFKRKMYDTLLDWKRTYSGRRAALIEGARRVGKTTVVRQFAKNEYKSSIIIDFSNIKKETMKTFEIGISDIDLFFSRLQISEGIQLHPRQSLIVFDEVQLYPLARQMIKHLVADGRYDYIETGSLISLKKNIENIVIPSEEKRYQMHPMDFEEFLWAQGDTATVPLIKDFFDKRQSLGNAAHRSVMNKYREYMMVGGMPAVVSTYLLSKNILDMDSEKRDILSLYEEDMGKIPSQTGTKASRIFKMTPSFLSSHTQYFSPGAISDNSRTRDYFDAIQWLKESMTINLCISTTDVSVFSELNLDENVFKCYMLDTGLLISAAFPKGSEQLTDIYKAFMFGKLPINAGMIFENMVSQELIATGHELIFVLFKYNESDRNYEIDFILTKGKKVIPIEVKSGRSRVHSSLDHFMEKYGDRLGEKFVIHQNDLEIKDGITYLPIYMTMFI